SGDVDPRSGINRHGGRRGDRRQRAPARDIGLIERIGLIRLAALERTADAHEAAGRRARRVHLGAGEGDVFAGQIDATALAGTAFGRDLARHGQIARAGHYDLAAPANFAGDRDFHAGQIDAAALPGAACGRDLACHGQVARARHCDLAAFLSARGDFARERDFRARDSDGPAVAAPAPIRSQGPTDIDDAAVAAVEHDLSGVYPDAVGADRPRDVDRSL